MIKDDKKFEGPYKIGIRLFVALLFVLEALLIFSFGSLFLSTVIAGVGTNVTVITKLNIGNVYPEVLNVTIIPTSIDLNPNSTKLIYVLAIVRDYNGENDLNISRVEFYDSTSSYGSGDDNNTHYTNNSCYIDTAYGDSYEVNVTCALNLWYNANNATWNATLRINDSDGAADYGNVTAKVNLLLAMGLPEEIDYGTVNATNVSNEKIANVTNFGNARLNITLEGYAVNRSDNRSMNCTLGSLKNISIYYEKYNLTGSNPGVLSLAQFEAAHVNLTSSPVVKKLGLNYQQDEGVNEAVNATYWRIYVPKGVAGSCSGNIIFGATRANGT